jgi:hypothetical protein
MRGKERDQKKNKLTERVKEGESNVSPLVRPV